MAPRYKILGFLIKVSAIMIIGVKPSIPTNGVGHNFEKFVDVNNGCEFEENWDGHPVMTIVDDPSQVECRSLEQINWVFNMPIKTKMGSSNEMLPFLIESEQRSCRLFVNKSVSIGRTMYYFVSILNIAHNHDLGQEGNWTRRVHCCKYGPKLPIGMEELPVPSPSVGLERIANTVPVFFDDLENRPQPLLMDVSKCENLLLNYDFRGKSCSCQFGRNFVQPYFLPCDNLVDCDFLAKNYNSNACRGRVVNLCNSSYSSSAIEFKNGDVNVSKSGLLFCSNKVSDPVQRRLTSVSYAFFLLLDAIPGYNKNNWEPPNHQKLNPATVIVLGDQVSSYQQFLKVTKVDDDGEDDTYGPKKFQTRTNLLDQVTTARITFRCCGPKFLFLTEFRWKVITMDEFSWENDPVKIVEPKMDTLDENDDLLLSTLTIVRESSVSKRRNGQGERDLTVSFMVVCEAPVRNTNELVSTNLTFAYPDPIGHEPGIDNTTMVHCTPEFNMTTFRCELTGSWSPMARLEWLDMDLKNYFGNSSFANCTQIQMGYTLLTLTCVGGCPETDNFSCIATDDQIGHNDSAIFTYTLCQSQVDLECVADDEDSITTTEETITATDTSFITRIPTTTDKGDNLDVGYPDDTWNKQLVIKILIALAAILIAIIIGIVGYIQRRRILTLCGQQGRLTSNKKSTLPEEVVHEFLHGKKSIDPDDLHGVINCQPFDSKYEIRRKDLALDEKNLLGSGHYANVMKGFLRKVDGNGIISMTTVAVKTIKPAADDAQFGALLGEIKIMACLGKHQNIVRFIGAFTENIKIREIFAAVEFCAKGDLLHLLRRSRMSFQNLMTFADKDYVDFRLAKMSPASVTTVSESGDTCATISTMNLLSWAVGIANGMAYLSLKKVIHGDLAARNILINEENVAKVSDFGLSKMEQNYENYLMTPRKGFAMPWKWMPMEAIRDFDFSIQSDVWSFGVTMWELFSLGSTPYPGQDWDASFLDRIRSGYRLEKPEFANNDIYELMTKCWTLEPGRRPAFPEIFNQFQGIFSTFENKCNGDYYVIHSESHV